MNWLDDDSIEEFMDSATHRAEVMRVHRTGVGEAWMVLSVEDRKYLGMVTRTGNSWDCFTVRDPRGTRVSDFYTALQLVVLASEATIPENVLGVETQEER